MKKITAFFNIIAITLLICLPGVSVLGASELQVPTSDQPAAATAQQPPATQYLYSEHPLERNGISLHLDSLATAGSAAQNNILLVHGSSYSSHEFDIIYLDYSLVRRLAQEGYTVWRIDIAGYGQSEAVEDGMMPDTEYASEDVHAAADRSGCNYSACLSDMRRERSIHELQPGRRFPESSSRRVGTGDHTGRLPYCNAGEAVLPGIPG